jgi:homoserine/homoserine lactone efflux protein
MNTELYFGFIIATAILAAIPGPVVTLLVATGTRQGSQAALRTLAGSTTALAVHVTVVGFGMSSLLALIGEWFTWIKWVGALYLIWLGVTAWRESYRSSNVTEPIQIQRSFWRGFIVGVTNPKTLLFYAAFFPQFIDPALSASFQLLVLCPTFVLVGGTIDLIYALSASKTRQWLTHPNAKRVTDRVSATILIAAGAGLAATRRF